MFNRSSLKVKNTKYYRARLTSFASGMSSEVDENLMPIRYASMTFNYSVKDGALKTGKGFNTLLLPRTTSDQNPSRQILLPPDVDILKVWHYRYYDTVNQKKAHMLVYYCSDQKLYWAKLVSIDASSYAVLGENTYLGSPNALSYKLYGEDVMIFTSDSDNMIVFMPGIAITTVATAPKITSMCLHYERLFAIVEGERNEIRFSDDLDPTNWTTSLSEGGYIQMVDERGALLKVLSFNDYVYVIREFGIARISAYGAQDEFSVSQVFSHSSLIYESSAQVCGDRIMFMSKSGLYAFDGISATKLTTGFEKLFENVSNENCQSAFYNEKYYLACRLNFGDDESVGCETNEGGYTNNALIEYDTNSGEINITRGVDIKSMTPIEDGTVSALVACFGGEHSKKIGMLTNDGCVFSTPLKKVWRSPYSNLSNAGKKKIIREIIVESEQDVSVVLNCDGTKKTYNLSGSSKCQKIRPRITAEKLSVAFETACATANISSPEIVYGVIDD